MLTDRLRRESTSKIRKIQMKAWYRILGTEILSYEEFYCKLNKLGNLRVKRIISGKMKIV